MVITFFAFMALLGFMAAASFGGLPAMTRVDAVYLSDPTIRFMRAA